MIVRECSRCHFQMRAQRSTCSTCGGMDLAELCPLGEKRGVVMTRESLRKAGSEAWHEFKMQAGKAKTALGRLVKTGTDQVSGFFNAMSSSRRAH